MLALVSAVGEWQRDNFSYYVVLPKTRHRFPRRHRRGQVAKTGRGNLFPGVTPDKPTAVLRKQVKLA